MRGYKNSHTDLTASFLKTILHYSPKTGIFTWKVSLGRRNNADSTAGYKADARIKIGIGRKTYMAHRLAYLYMTSKWPKYEVDHRNRNQSDNRWKNLRHATPSQNHRNRGKQQNNTVGYKGVCFDKRSMRYIAGVKLNGYRHNLGAFKTAEEAYVAYKKAAKRLHGSDWAHF